MIAGGLTLIFGLMGVLNFAHGSLTMFGAYLGGYEPGELAEDDDAPGEGTA